MNEQLLPCAFCGCTKVPVRQGNGIGDYWLECTECGGGTKLREDGAGNERDWNRRPSNTDLIAPAAPKDNGSTRAALVRIEKAVDWYLGRSAFTQSTSLKGLEHSNAVRKEIYAAHDEVRAALAAPVATVSVAPHADDLAVDAFAAAMKEKLAQARDKGRDGWQQCDPDELSVMLREHVEKGDPRDVANFCMFLWSLGQSIGNAVLPWGKRAAQVRIYQIGSPAGSGTVWWDVDRESYEREKLAGYMKTGIVYRVGGSGAV